MKKHLEHYGYFTGRNMAIARFGFEPKRTGSCKNENDSNESDTSSEDSDENSTNKLIKNKIDWKNKSSSGKFEGHKWVIHYIFLLFLI